MLSIVYSTLFRKYDVATHSLALTDRMEIDFVTVRTYDCAEYSGREFKWPGISSLVQRNTLWSWILQKDIRVLT